MSEILDEEEELLTLRLCIDSKWTSKEKGEDDSVSAGNISSVDSKISRLLEARDKVFGEGRVDIPRYHEESKNVRLVGLLFEAATAVDIHDLSSAIDTLQEIYMSSSLISDPIQRVVAYFADALATRLFSPRSRFYGSMNKICATQEDEFLAFLEYYRVLPFYQFAHFTANQEMIEAFEEEAVINGGRIHVIDFDASYGFQWPSLIQSLSDMATTSRAISLTITGYGRNVEELRVTKERLESFANGCANLSFKFEGILTGSSFTSIKVEANSTLVVNLPFYLQTLSSSQEIKDTLASVYSMNPSLVVLVEKEGNQRTRSFLPNFMELLYFYTAIFDSLHELLPLESIERFNIEKNYLGKKIKLEIGQGNHIEETFEHDKSWKETMKGFGFEGKKMSSRSLSQAKLLLKIKSPCTMIGDGANNCGFEVFERDESHEIALTWRDRALVSISCWRRTSW